MRKHQSISPSGARRFQFPKSNRIKLQRDFNRVFKRGRRIKARCATYWIVPNSLNICRLGISVGRRYGNAVTRNRAKRIFREAFRMQRVALPKGTDMVVIPVLEAKSLQLAAVSKELIEIFPSSKEKKR